MNEPNAEQPTAPANAAEAAAGAPETDMAAALAAVQAKADENYDLFMRARAEMDNVRRRAEDEVAKARKFSIESFAENLLPVVDSLEKALEVSAGEIGPMREGLELTHRQLMNALERSGMKQIQPLGEKFDPHSAQAIAMIPAPGVPAGHVAQVFQPGWMIADRVLRPAMVAVAQA